MKEQQQQMAEKIIELEWLLRQISSIIKQKGREILNDFPITLPQFIALQWLKECGDMTVGELSAKMCLANSTTTDLVDRLEKNQLVARVRSENDRRVVRIHLLQKGREIIDEVIRHRQKYLHDILSHFKPEEVDMIHQSLTLLFREMEKDHLK